MATISRSPTGDNSTAGSIAYSSGSTGYNLVNDYPDTADPLTSYVTLGTTANSAILFNFTAFDVPTGSTGISLAIEYYDEEPASGANTSDGYIRVGGTNYASGTTHNISTTTTSRTKTFANNPKTSAAWTVAEINGSDATNPLQAFGVIGPDSNPVWRLGAIRATVTYTPPSQTLTPSLYTSADGAFYAPTVTRWQTLTQSSSATNSPSFYAPTATTTYTMSVRDWGSGSWMVRPGWDVPYATTNLFYAPTLEQAAGSLSLTASLYSNTNTFYAPTVKYDQTVTQSSSATNTNTFYSPTFTIFVTPNAWDDNWFPVTGWGLIYGSTNVLYSSTVSTSYSLAQSSRLDNSNTVYSHSLTSLISLDQSSRLDNSGTFYSGTISTTYNLTAPYAVNTTVIYLPQVDTTYGLSQSSTYDNSSVVYDPSVSHTDADLTAPLFTNTTTFYVSTISREGGVDQVTIFDNENTFYSHSIIADQVVEADLYSNTNEVYSHSVAIDQILVPVRYDNTTTYLVHSLYKQYPDPSEVRLGVVYGAPGLELTGSLVPGFTSGLKVDVTSGKMVKILTDKVALTI